MRQTMLDLWNGRLAPCEHCGSHDAKSNRLAGLMERYREALREQLTAGQKEDFQKYLDCSSGFLFRSMELAFQEGFCLGSKLMMETIT